MTSSCSTSSPLQFLADESHLSADNNIRSDSLSTFLSTPYYAPTSGKKFHVSHYPHIHIDFIYYLRQVGSVFIGVNLFIYLLAGLRKLQFRLLFNRATFPKTTRNLCRVSLRSSESNEENLRKLLMRDFPGHMPFLSLTKQICQTGKQIRWKGGMRAMEENISCWWYSWSRYVRG